MHFEMISEMLSELLDEKTVKNDPPNSSQEMMRVLPEQVTLPDQSNCQLKLYQILTWLKSTFGTENATRQDDKKRTFRGVVAAMRVIYGFKGKNDNRQSGN